MVASLDETNLSNYLQLTMNAMKNIEQSRDLDRASGWWILRQFIAKTLSSQILHAGCSNTK